MFFNLLGVRRNPRREGERVFIYPVRGLRRRGSFVVVAWRGRSENLEWGHGVSEREVRLVTKYGPGLLEISDNNMGPV